MTAGTPDDLTDGAPLTEDARRWLDRARELIGLDPAPWEGDSLRATINRALLNQVVAAEMQTIEDALRELGGPFTGLLGGAPIQIVTAEPRSCRCVGGCEQEAEPGADLCRGCRMDGCDAADR